jgi:Ca-activated chloride channel family protein
MNCIGLAHVSRGSAAPVPLRGVRVEARLVGGAARLDVHQRYENVESTPIEAAYTFPLDADAAVCGFVARLGDRTVTAEVDEREAAFDTYDDAMAAGHTAVLLDQERPDVFSASLGNLRAGEEATLSLQLVQPLRREGKSWRFTLPTTIAPRYTPTSTGEIGVPQGELLNPPKASHVPYGLSLRVRVEGAVRRVESPSHPIRTEIFDDHAIVELSQVEAVMDRDLVILVEPRDPALAQASVETWTDGERYLAVEWLVPEVAADEAPREVVFLVDCSGSMSGPSIQEARSALALCLRALQPGDRFDIIRFGSSFQAMFGQLRPYDAASCAAALTWAAETDANLGGTEILAALKAAVRGATGGARRDVLLLTDGEVSNEPEVIHLAAENAGGTRISTFGIGHAASATLVRGVARATGGFTASILPGERVEAKVLRTFGLLRATPLPVRVGVEGEVGATADIAYGGELFRTFYRINGPTPPAIAVTAGPLRCEIPVTTAPPGAALVPLLWARERIREVENATGRRGSAQSRGGRQDRQATALVALGKKFGLINSATSFVGVIQRADAGAALPEATLRRVPLVPPPGQGAMDTFASAPPMRKRAAMPMSPPMLSAPAGAPPMAAYNARGGLMSRVVGAVRGLTRREEAQVQRAAPPVPAPPPRPAPAPAAPAAAPDLYALLSTQGFDGHFAWSEALSWRLGLLADEARALCAAHPHAATRLVIAVLERHEAGREDEWRAAVAKARRALGTQVVPPEVSAFLSRI